MVQEESIMRQFKSTIILFVILVVLSNYYFYEHNAAVPGKANSVFSFKK